MVQPLRGRSAERPVRIRFSGTVFDCAPSETVLDLLLRNRIDVVHSCRKGTCLTCMMRASRGAVPRAAQDGLSDTLRDQGYFLPCQCVPTEDLEMAAPDDAALFGRARVVAVEDLAPDVRRVRLEPETRLDYRAGQFVNLRRADGLVRSYSLASVKRLDPLLDIHVKRRPRGRMSGWIFDGLAPGEGVALQGPNGSSYYLPGRPAQPMLLIGNGTGLAPLYGVARDALHRGHSGPVLLYHGTRHADGLYLVGELEDLEARFANFVYTPCLSGAAADGRRAGRADAVAFADHPDLKGVRVFLCGHPGMVHAARRTAFLAGAGLDDIHIDPFELSELRA